MRKKYDYFYGIRGIRFIWHGTNADPELSYLGHVVNYYAVEDYFWSLFKEEFVNADEDRFEGFIRSMAKDVKQYILDISSKK